MPKPKRDFTQVAHDVFRRAIGETPAVGAHTQESARVRSGRSGGLKGGKARSDRMTPEERRESARREAAARWKAR